MIVQLNKALASATGNLGDYYIRQLNGKLIMQRRPAKFSAQQLANQKRFAEAYVRNASRMHQASKDI